MELFSPHHRTMAGVAAEVFWAVGLILLAACCYFVQHWRYIQLVISTPTLVTLLYIWLILESLRWLISWADPDEPGPSPRGSSYNGLRLSPELLLQLEKLCHTSERTRHGVWILGTCFERRQEGTRLCSSAYGSPSRSPTTAYR